MWKCSLHSFKIALLFLTAFGVNAAEPQTTPLWEGIEKTAAMKRADKDFVDEVLAATKGDAKLGARHAVRAGWKAFSDGQYDSAIRRFNQAWLLDPENPEIFWGFGLATHLRGEPLSTVERWFLEAKERLPDAAPLHSDHGRVLSERGEPRRAINHFRKALQLDPDHAEAHVGMIRAAHALGDSVTADRHRKALLLLRE